MTCANSWSSTALKVNNATSGLSKTSIILILHRTLELAASFPIKEMPRSEETSNFIGMTYFNLCTEVDAETTKGKTLYQTVRTLLRNTHVWLTNTKVDRVEVQLFDDNDKFLPIFRLLPTLLHEWVLRALLFSKYWLIFWQIRARTYRGAPCLWG